MLVVARLIADADEPLVPRRLRHDSAFGRVGNREKGTRLANLIAVVAKHDKRGNHENWDHPQDKDGDVPDSLPSKE